MQHRSFTTSRDMPEINVTVTVHRIIWSIFSLFGKDN